MKKLLNNIRENAHEFGSIPFWSWNDRLEPEELRRQIRKMHELGMSGFFMHARGGLETEYMGEDWFSCVDACVDEAERLGMSAWCYDENGWPSGFGGGALLTELKNHALAVEQRRGAYPTPEEDVIAVYRILDEGFELVDHDCGDEEYLVLFRRYDAAYVDTLNPAVAEQFIECTYAEYKRRIPVEKFGKGLPMPGFFTDEPQYYRWGTPYSDTLPEIFEQECGYSIYEKLPALYYSFEGADKFRYDYYYLIHRLFTDNFIKKIYEWCEENGVAITGHAVEETSLGGQMMCCGGVMPFYQYETIPGVDYLGRTVLDDISFKQLSSACAQLGKKQRLSEMFACCGWDVSPRELKRIADVQYAGGVNLMCQHLYPYSERGQRKRDYPLHYSEHNPWQEDLGDFNNYYRNLGAALSEGEEYAPILAIHPIHGAYCKYIKDSRSLDGAGQECLKEIDDQFFLLSRKLGRNQVPYHWGDEWMMRDMAKVHDGKITIGNCTYEAVILPFTYSLDSSTVALLREYVAQGGRLWMWAGLPDYVDGLPRGDRLDFLSSNITFDDLLAYRSAVVDEYFEGLRVFTKLTDSGKLMYLTNVSEDELTRVKLHLSGEKWAVVDINSLEPIGCIGGECELDFSDGKSYLLIETDEELPEYKNPVLGEIIEIPDTARLTKKPRNVYTLDVAELSYDGVNYEEPLAIVGIKDNLLRARYNGDVWLRFTYESAFVPTDLRFIVEPMYESVWVNGAEVTPTADKWWFDRSFRGADIAELTRIGRNEIVVKVHHYQKDYVYYVLYESICESLRNCLVFDTEIESAYLVGDFRLNCDGKFTDEEHSAVTFEGKFTLSEQKDTVSTRDIIRDGYPFFSGRMELEFDYDYSGGADTLELTGRFSVAEVFVNGQSAGKLLWQRQISLGGHLKAGKNTVKIAITTAMRNTMGPHHRPEAEPYAVGPQHFSFERAWRGRECAEYRERYAFVRVGVKE